MYYIFYCSQKYIRSVTIRPIPAVGTLYNDFDYDVYSMRTSEVQTYNIISKSQNIHT